MSQEILNEILENTKSVKEIVVEKDIAEKAEKAKKDAKAEKAKDAKAEAEAKFTRVGTKFNEQGMQKFNDKLEALGVNQSQYIKDLIEKDLEHENQSAMSFDDTSDLEALQAKIGEIQELPLLTRIFGYRKAVKRILRGA